jgi:hypothetical protein
MMDRRLLGWALVAVGAVLVLVSALADPLEIGAEGSDVGWKQIVGVIVGAAVAAVGLGLTYVRRGGETKAPTAS